MNQTPDEFRQAFLLPFIAAVLTLHGLADFAARKSEEHGASEPTCGGNPLDIRRTASRAFGNAGIGLCGSLSFPLRQLRFGLTLLGLLALLVKIFLFWVPANILLLYFIFARDSVTQTLIDFLSVNQLRPAKWAVSLIKCT